MMNKGKNIQLVKIFAAASGELKNERKELINIVNSTNKIFDHLKLEVIEWETDIPSGSYHREKIQDEINPYLEESQIVIVLFFSKIGKFTVEEYSHAIKSRKKVFLYFKQDFSPKNPLESKAHMEVLKFKNSLVEENKTLYQEFRTMDEFKLLIKNDLTLYSKQAFPIISTIPHIPPSDSGLNDIEKTVEPSPYRGLSAFQAKDAAYFFGREEATKKLYKLVRKKTIVTVLGASGSGKSSLVFAGLVPRLRKNQKWLVVTFRPGDRPFYSIAACLIHLLEKDLNEISRLEQTRKLAEAMKNRKFELRDIIENILKKNIDRNFLLVCDQFEEIFTLSRDMKEERSDCEYFLEQCLKTKNIQCQGQQQSFKLVLTLRADFLGQALSNSNFTDVLQYSDFKLGALKKEEMKRAIELPVGGLGVWFADGLANRLVDTVAGQAGDLPLLQFTLTALWNNRTSNKISHELYQKIGCVENALANYAEQVFEKFGNEEQIRAKRIFLLLVRLGEGTEDTRRIATQSELGEIDWTLVSQLADTRLVITGINPATGEKIVEVVHEALITHWQRLREWVESDRIFLAWRARLKNSRKQWEMCGNDKGSLLRGIPLAEAEEWLQRRPEEIGEVDQKYISASQLNAREEAEYLKKLYREAETAREQAETANQARSKFLTNISHEFNTPLTLIIGPLEQMLDDCKDFKRKTELETIFRNSKRLKILIDRLLELTWFDSGKMTLQTNFKNIVPFIEGIIASFESYAGRNQLDLTFKAEENNISLYYDAQKIEDVMYNLLINALKFTPSGGRIIVSLSRGHEESEGTSKFLKISVNDTGIGIPAEKLGQVFDRFYHTESLREQAFKGSGLGLTVTKEIIKLHHGKILINSRQGEGSEFIVLLPLSHEHLQTNEIVTSTEASVGYKKTEIKTHYLMTEEEEIDKNSVVGSEDTQSEADTSYENGIKEQEKPVILIVEDHAGLRKFIREPLELLYTVVEANDGEEGIEKALKLIPDLIISDIMMPNINGYQLCKHLKEDFETSHIPIILLTAKVSEENYIEGLETGADDYITKPFSTKILHIRIKNLMEQRVTLQKTFQRQLLEIPARTKISSMDEKFIRQFKEIAEKNFTDPDFRIDDIMEQLDMKRSTFFKKIKALTGENPNHFILELRLKRAKHLLDDEFGTITEVAIESGFASSAYFTKNFKEKYGLSPTEYLRSEI